MSYDPFVLALHLFTSSLRLSTAHGEQLLQEVKDKHASNLVDEIHALDPGEIGEDEYADQAAAFAAGMTFAADAITP